LLDENFSWYFGGWTLAAMHWESAAVSAGTLLLKTQIFGHEGW